MSLIDEALKRAELEAARRDGLRTGASPWAMGTRARGRRWPIFAAAFLLLAAVAGAFFWLARRPAAVAASSHRGPETAAQAKVENPKSKIEMETVEVPPPPASIKPKDPSHAEPPKAEAPKPAEKSVESAKSVAASPRPAPARADKRAVSPSEDRSAPSASAPAPPADSRNPKGLANGRTYVGEVVIPEGGKVTLEGIVWSETNPIALVNGKVLPPGAIVEEFTITSIQPDRIELKGRGVTISLALK